jgi:parvulin-like peptidyl-prolyl isomerase
MTREKHYGWLEKVLAWSFSALFFAGGCGDSSDPASSEDQLQRSILVRKAGQPGVLIVGNEVVTCDEIIATPMEYNQMIVSLAELLAPAAQAGSLEQFKQLARPRVEEVITSRISYILLYQQAKRQVGENIDESLEKAAEKEWRRFVLRFGGDEAKAEEALRQQKVDRKGFKDYWKKEILRQSYIALKLAGNRPITQRELMQCYDEMKDKSFATPASLTFRLIDIEPAKLQIADPQQDLLERARKLARELVDRIRAGEDFAELAKQYSHGHTRESGGLWKPVHPDSLAKPYDVLVAAAAKIEQGQIAGPIEVEGHIFIMKLQENRPKSYKPFEKVQEQLEQKILADRQKEAIEKLNAELREQIVLSERDQFVDFCLERIYQVNGKPSVKLKG